MNDSRLPEQLQFSRHFQAQAQYLRRTMNGWRGSSCVYQLNIPVNGIHDCVIVSVIKLDNGDYEGIVCPCDYNGKLYSDRIISVSHGPNINHVEVLRAMGYEVNGQPK